MSTLSVYCAIRKESTKVYKSVVGFFFSSEVVIVFLLCIKNVEIGFLFFLPERNLLIMSDMLS